MTIMLIGNKADLEHRRAVTCEEGEQFAVENGAPVPMQCILQCIRPRTHGMSCELGWPGQAAVQCEHLRTQLAVGGWRQCAQQRTVSRRVGATCQGATLLLALASSGGSGVGGAGCMRQQNSSLGLRMLTVFLFRRTILFRRPDLSGDVR